MALYDKASLVLIPSGTKAGKVYSQKPTSGDGDFDFTRSTYATRVNSQGLIEKERSNLLLQSNSFDTNPTWTTTSSTLTSGQSGYDGSSDAWLLEATSTSARVVQNNTTSGVQTFSCYAKAGTANYLAFYNIVSGSPPRAWFNLSNGTIENANHYIDANIESVGSGWYRCSLTYNATLSNVRIYVAVTAGSFSDTSSGDNIYIQDAQLEQGLVATDVIETTTSAVYTGITDNVPRLDYDGDCPSLLLEPQRTNLVIHSEYLAGLNQNTLNLSLSTNLSPEGKYNAYRAERVSGSQLGSSFAATSGNTYTTSIYARSISGSGQIKITDYQGSENVFNITSDWARYELSAEATQSTGRAYVRLPQIGDVVEFYGLQSEQGSYATSYIPTYGTSVTRNGDLWKNTNLNDIIDTSNGFSFFIETSATELTEVGFAEFFAFRISDSNDDTIRMEMRTNGTIGVFSGAGQIDNFPTLNDTNQFVIGQVNKTAIVITNNVQKFFVNGVLTASFTNSITLPTFEHLRLERSIGQAAQMKFAIDKMVLFPTELTDQECIDLTT